MIADGALLVMVLRQLSHAQASTTANIYAHAIVSAQAKAMRTFDRFNDIVRAEKPSGQGMKKATGKSIPGRSTVYLVETFAKLDAK